MGFKHYLILGIIAVLIGAGVPSLYEMLAKSERLGQETGSINEKQIMSMLKKSNINLSSANLSKFLK